MNLQDDEFLSKRLNEIKQAKRELCEEILEKTKEIEGFQFVEVSDIKKLLERENE